MSWRNAISFINIIFVFNILQQYEKKDNLLESREVFDNQGKYSSKSMQYRPLNPFRYDALKDKRDKVTHVYIGGVFLSLRVLNWSKSLNLYPVNLAQQ